MSQKKELDIKSLTISQIRSICRDNAKLDNEFIEALSRDSRCGVKQIYLQLQQKKSRQREDMKFLRNLFKPEENLWKRGYSVIAGIDEAGRGPLAGPVVAAAVVLPGFVEIPGLKDSKKLTPNARKKLAKKIKKVCVDWSVSLSTVSEILCYNIYWASLLAMKRAVMGLSFRPEYVLVDGFAIKDLDIPQKPLVGGDGICASIAAASILAKVTRDELMRVLHLLYPQYGFINHKGYGTREHILALERYGPCPAHRVNFAPVRKVLSSDRSLWDDI